MVVWAAVAVLLVVVGTSALICWRVVVRSLTPFVWPSIELRVLGLGVKRRYAAGIRLHGAGPGPAFNVVFALTGGKPAVGGMRSNVDCPIPAISPGAVVPPERVHGRDDDPAEYRIPLGDRIEDGPLAVTVQYRDALGRRWQTRGRLGMRGTRVTRPRRLRRWPWELWRSKGTKLDREAREPPAPKQTGKGSLVTAPAVRD